MYVRDSKGNYYEIGEAVLKNKKVDASKAREALVAERAEKRKKMIDFLSSLDEDEITILHDTLIGASTGRTPFDCRDPGHAACDCKSSWNQGYSMGSR